MTFAYFIDPVKWLTSPVLNWFRSGKYWPEA